MPSGLFINFSINLLALVNSPALVTSLFDEINDSIRVVPDLGVPKIKKLSSKKKIVDISKGDMVSFPSSLFHSTIPFSSEEDRITLAFDIIPIN